MSKTIILTHCDVATQKQISSIENAIKQVHKNLDIIRVCSVSGTACSGKETRSFDNDFALQKILSISYKKDEKYLMTTLCEDIMYHLGNILDSLNEKIDMVDI